MTKLRFCFILIALLNHYIANCQSTFPNFHISKFGLDDGLSQGSNYFKYEDSKGFMWLTCNDAINRYDGKMVKVYNLDKYFKDCPNLQQGYGFVEDSNSNIYIGSVRGLYIYHREQDKFTLQKIFDNGVDDIAMPIAYKDGKIWCFNRLYQLAAYDINSKKVVHRAEVNLTPLVSIHIYYLIRDNVFYYHYPFMDKSGTLWLIGNDNVGCYNTYTQQKDYPLYDYCRKNNITILSSHYDQLQHIILLGTRNGIISYNIASKEIKTTNKIGDINLGIVKDITSNKDFIILKSGYGIIYISDKNLSKIKALSSDSYIHSRTDNFLFDKSNRLWVSDDGQGQLIFDFKDRVLNKVPDENTKTDYFSHNGVGRISETYEGKIIIPVYFYDFMAATYDKQVHEAFPFKAPYIFGSECYGIAPDKVRKGTWFFSENLPGQEPLSNIILYKDKNVVSYIKEKNFDVLGLQQDMIVLPDGKPLCSFQKGLFWLNTQTKNMRRVKGTNLINSFKINVLSKNRLAISYLNSDMLLFKVLPDSSVQLQKVILPKIQSFYMAEDSVRNRYWVGTNQGIYLLDKNFEVLHKFDANNQLAGTYIYGLLLDDDGNAYCSHQRGLSSINASTFQIINFDKNDGIQDWDFNNRAFHKSADGTLFFGGSKGFNYFKPPLVPYSFYKSEVYIDEIWVNNQQYSPNTNADYLQKINLNYRENNITIKAIVRDLANANYRQLIYKIKETDKDWHYLPNNTPLIFNSLSPRTYTIELGYYDKYTNKNIKQKELIICIAAPFYTRIWFLTLVIFGAIFSLFAIINRIRQTKQRNSLSQQLALAKQRNKITADLHDDIGASLSSLQLNSAVANQLINKSIDDTKKILTKIEEQSKDLADKMGDIIWSMKPLSDEFMTMSSRIKNFTNDILDATDIYYTININPIIDSAITDIATRKNLILIAKEAVNNAAKYSKANQLKIDLQIDHKIIKLFIIDDGVGFDIASTNGNGLRNMRKRAEELNGQFSLHSKPNAGTIIIVEIPLLP